jgi:hypothetical protein
VRGQRGRSVIRPVSHIDDRRGANLRGALPDIVIRLLGDADSAVKAQKAAADAAEVTVQQYRKAEREYDRSQKAMESRA